MRGKHEWEVIFKWEVTIEEVKITRMRVLVSTLLNTVHQQMINWREWYSFTTSDDTLSTTARFHKIFAIDGCYDATQLTSVASRIPLENSKLHFPLIFKVAITNLGKYINIFSTQQCFASWWCTGHVHHHVTRQCTPRDPSVHVACTDGSRGVHWWVTRRALTGHVACSDGSRGVHWWVTWRALMGHVVCTDGSRGVHWSPVRKLTSAT